MDNGCCTYRKRCGGRVWGPFRGWPCLGGSPGISCVAWKAGGTCHRWGQSLGALVWRRSSPHPGPTAVPEDIVGRAWGTPSSKEEIQEVSQLCLTLHRRCHSIFWFNTTYQKLRFILMLHIMYTSFITSTCTIPVDSVSFVMCCEFPIWMLHQSRNTYFGSFTRYQC